MAQNAKAQKQKFALEGYNISIICKHFQLTDPIRDYAIEKISKIDRFTDRILEILINLDVQKLEHSCSVDVKFLNFKIRAHASMDDLYSAIDKATDRLVRLIQKYKAKLQEKQAITPSVIDLKVNVFRPYDDDLSAINDEIEAENARIAQEKYQFHKIVSKEVTPLRFYTQEEAIMHMELSGDKFMVYKGEEDRKLKVIYRREEDDHFGVIEVE